MNVRDPIRTKLVNDGIDREVARLLALYLRGASVQGRALAHVRIVDIIVEATNSD